MECFHAPPVKKERVTSLSKEESNNSRKIIKKNDKRSKNYFASHEKSVFFSFYGSKSRPGFL
jgi:hypothetical protein